MHQLIAAQLAKPITHDVVTTYADGAVRTLGARSVAQAETHAIVESRKIGRALVDRNTGNTVCVVSVTVVAR